MTHVWVENGTRDGLSSERVKTGTEAPSRGAWRSGVPGSGVAYQRHGSGLSMTQGRNCTSISVLRASSAARYPSSTVGAAMMNLRARERGFWLGGGKGVGWGGGGGGGAYIPFTAIYADVSLVHGPEAASILLKERHVALLPLARPEHPSPPLPPSLPLPHHPSIHSSFQKHIYIGHLSTCPPPRYSRPSPASEYHAQSPTAAPRTPPCASAWPGCPA